MKKTLRKIIEYAAFIAEPEIVFLFGSMATETMNVYSDVDLLIISKQVIDKNNIIAKIKSYSSELSLKIDILLYSELEVEQEKQNCNSFVANILNSGKIVYKK